jgi:NTE family protein
MRARDEGLPVRRAAALAMLATVLGGCASAHYRVNPPLVSMTGTGAAAATLITAPANAPLAKPRSETLYVALAFSGGGTRAAAFAYGVLEALAGTTITWEGRTTRLVDEVDTISSVSGGSFTAAYFGLFGDRIFEDFESGFLERDVQRDLTDSLWSPGSWRALGSETYGRSEVAEEYYDRILFEGRTFGEIAARGGPEIEINATDIGLGVQFPFTPAQFDLICSDLARFPVSRAVTASSAVPLVFSPVTLHNHTGTCDEGLPQWADDALETPDRHSRAYRLASLYTEYMDRERLPYIHLVDGGLSDNLGVRPFINRLSLAGDAWRLGKARGLGATRRILLVVVNAQAGLNPSLRRTPSPSIAEVVEASTTIPLNEYSFESLDALRRVARVSRQQFATGRCRERATDPSLTPTCDDFAYYIVEVDFAALPDGGHRRALERLPTSYRLAENEVDSLRAAAAHVLLASSEFNAFLSDLERTERASGARR